MLRLIGCLKASDIKAKTSIKTQQLSIQPVSSDKTVMDLLLKADLSNIYIRGYSAHSIAPEAQSQAMGTKLSQHPIDAAKKSGATKRLDLTTDIIQLLS